MTRWGRVSNGARGSKRGWRRSVVAAVAAAALLAMALVGGAGADPGEGFERARAAKERHVDALLARPDVVGAAVGASADGAPAVLVLTTGPTVRSVPDELDGVPVVVRVTGPLTALHHRDGHDGGPGRGGGNGDDDPDGDAQHDPTDRHPRPVPIGVSTGNEGSCGAGTVGARVVDGAGNVYALSNNHVYALENAAPLGSRVLQPGLFDTGCAFDDSNVLGTLADFVPIAFDGQTANRVDAAIAMTTGADLGTGTPPDGYGTPKAAITEASVGDAVQKYGRTSGLTSATVTGVDATVRVSFSSGTAVFTGQVIFEGRRVVRPGDSGSLLVTDPGKSPTGLVFAGSRNGHLGLANPIGDVLASFGVTIDGE